MKNTFSIITILILLSLALPACGGGGGGSNNTSDLQTDEAINASGSSFDFSIIQDLLRSCGINERPLRIMPLGDSITESKSGYSSYRYRLWQMLTGAGCSVDFVGSRSGVSTGTRNSAQVSPKNTNFDQDHEGHWDYRTDEIVSRLANWAAQAFPDIVLIHLGTNDIFQSQSNSSTLEELRQVIEILRNENPYVVILLAQLIPADRDRDTIEQFNALIPDLAKSLTSTNSPVVVVDHYADFYVSSDTFDGIHPDDSGDEKMASRWFNALMAVLMSM